MRGTPVWYGDIGVDRVLEQVRVLKVELERINRGEIVCPTVLTCDTYTLENNITVSMFRSPYLDFFGRVHK